jgi:hypothetical protein
VAGNRAFALVIAARASGRSRQALDHSMNAHAESQAANTKLQFIYNISAAKREKMHLG